MSTLRIPREWDTPAAVAVVVLGAMAAIALLRRGFPTA